MTDYNYAILRDLATDLILRLRLLKTTINPKVDISTYAEQITYIKILKSIKRFDKRNTLRINYELEKYYPLI